MATVYKRGNIWWARWYRDDGSRTSKTTGCEKKREAERVAASLEEKDRKSGQDKEVMQREFLQVLESAVADARRGVLSLDRARDYLTELVKAANPGFRVLSLESHIAEWVKSQAKRVKPGTAAIYRDMQRQFLQAFGPRISAAPVSDLTKSQVERAVHKITETKLRGSEKRVKAATANMALRALRRALQAAVADRQISFNPAEDVKPLSTSDSIERAPFSAEEFWQLAGSVHASTEWQGAALFGGHTGLRLNDIIKLGDANFDNEDLVIRPTKTERQQRKPLRIPLSPELLVWIGENGGKGAWFPTLSKTQKGTLSTQFKRIMLKSGVPDQVVMPGGIKASRSFHSLRHSFTSWLAEADVQADVRQKLTGHASAGIHAKYTHHDESLRRAISALPSSSGALRGGGKEGAALEAVEPAGVAPSELP